MRTSAKLQGLATLVENLKRKQGDAWRMVVFTCRRETQTTIQVFLEQHGISAVSYTHLTLPTTPYV